MKITFDNRKETLKQLNKASCVRFAIGCARLVGHLDDDPRVEAAIVAAENWLEDPSEENRQAAYAAADAAYAAYAAAHAAAHAAYGAYGAYGAAYGAAYAVASADAAHAAAYGAASAAAYGAYAASHAAYWTVKADPTTEQQIVQLLKEIYLETLPEEERNCWLVQATLRI